MSASPSGIAVVGMSCRFPGAANVREFWANLRAGVESIARLGDAELLNAGVPAHLLRQPGYVKAAPILKDVDRFDAGFFHLSPREAVYMDPQHRLFLECAWEALEDACCDPAQYRGAIGVYAGAGGSLASYLFAYADAFREYLGATGGMHHIGNDKDFLASRVSFKLNLRGPSLAVQTACSTSLVAVHLACQSLLMGEADMALAGGVTVRVPHRAGYLYQEGNILSPDGYCRPYSAQAQGTVFGSGVGIVVLKPLAKALAERDRIYAVIKGSAINNDGGAKISYTASSVDGQVRAMVEALAVAEVAPRTVSYVEGHGTATALGDPLEVEALARAFRDEEMPRPYCCALGSVKSNLGHLEAAAGVAGLIKTILALHHRQLPPSLHCDETNRRIDFASSPFRVQTRLEEWNTGTAPRRAGVNSLGIGGTNAFVVIEEAPDRAWAGPRSGQTCVPTQSVGTRNVVVEEAPVPAVKRPLHLLCLSARSGPALGELVELYEQHLECHPSMAIGDGCFTAGIGRAHFEQRRAVLCRSSTDALDLLQQIATGLSPEGSWSGEVDPDRAPRIAFLFPDSHTWYAGIGRQLLDTQPTFRQAVTRCTALLQPHFGQHLESSAALFAIEIAFAELWQSWGVQPDALFGRGIGELAASCVAGVLSLEEAIQRLVEREAAPDALIDAGKPASATESSRRSVMFERTKGKWSRVEWSGAEEAALEGYDFCVVMGPAPKPDGRRLSSFCQGQDDWACMLSSLARLYVKGVPIDWAGFERDYPHRRKVSLPTYPFQRQRYWIERPTVSAAMEPRIEPSPILGQRRALPEDSVVFETPMTTAAFPFLADHRIYEKIVVPGALWVSMVLAALVRESRGGTIESIEFARALVLNDEDSQVVCLKLAASVDGKRSIQVVSLAAEDDPTAERVHAIGTLSASGMETPERLDVQRLFLDKQEKTSKELYERYHELGLDLGPAFRGVRRLWLGPGEVVGEIEAPAPLHDADAGYEFHPALLDACFQVGMAAALSHSDLFVPWQIERAWFYARPGQKFYCRAVLRSGAAHNQETLTADLSVCDPAGARLADIQGLTLKRAQRKALFRALSPLPRAGTYLEEWRLQERPARRPEFEAEAGLYLLFTLPSSPGNDLAHELRAAGQRCILVHPGAGYQMLDNGDFQIDPASKTDCERLIDEVTTASGQPPRGLIYLWELGPEIEGLDTFSALAGAWRLARTLHGSSAAASTIWFVTRGIQWPAGEATLASLTVGAIRGLAAALTSDQPGPRGIWIDLADPVADNEGRLLFEEIAADSFEEIRAFRGGERHVARLVRDREPALPAGAFQLHCPESSILDQFTFLAGNVTEPGPGQAKVRVRATGLNFRDLLNALGIYPGDAGPLGMECAGIVTAVGAGVEHLAVGDEVVGFARASFASTVELPAALMARKPAHLGFDEAATIPVSFATAYLSLHERAGLRPGERVLIHAAAGGFGLAALQLARQAGAEIFATASAGKWDYLRAQGIEHVMDSRSLEFAGQVMVATQGRGVDVVVNSLSGDFIPKSLAVLAPNGRFIEIGKQGIWSAEQIARARPDVAYHVIALDRMIEDDPEQAGSLLRKNLPRFESGEWQPLPSTVYPIRQASSAFRFMQQARHIGKIVVSMPALAEGTFRSDGCYLVTGGLGKRNLLLARWLFERGARHLVLQSQRPPSALAESGLEALRREGCNLKVLRADLTDEEDLTRAWDKIALEAPPLRGVFHLPGFQKPAADQFQTTLASEILSAWNLHRLAGKPSIDCFVLFSTAAALLGVPGSAEHAVLGSYLDRLAHERRRQGLHALSINWGAWEDSAEAGENGLSRGLCGLAHQPAFDLLGELLRQDRTQAAVLAIDWRRFVKTNPGRPPALIADLASPRISRQISIPQGEPEASTTRVSPHGHAPVANASSSPLMRAAPMPSALRRRLEEAGPVERVEMLAQHLQDRIASLLGMSKPALSDRRKEFLDLGMDSLMTVELRNQLKVDLGSAVQLDSSLVFDHPTIDALSARLDEILFASK